jgi:hypothetical protein
MSQTEKFTIKTFAEIRKLESLFDTARYLNLGLMHELNEMVNLQ